MSSEDMQKLKEESKSCLPYIILKAYNEINGAQRTPSTIIEIGDNSYRVFKKLSNYWSEKLITYKKEQ